MDTLLNISLNWKFSDKQKERNKLIDAFRLFKDPTSSDNAESIMQTIEKWVDNIYETITLSTFLTTGRPVSEGRGVLVWMESPITLFTLIRRRL